MEQVLAQIEREIPDCLYKYREYVTFFQTDHDMFDFRIHMRFENKMGVSMLKRKGAWGSQDDWEIALLGIDGQLVYDDDRYDGVCPGLNNDELVEHIEFIKNHDWPNFCDCCGARLFERKRYHSLWWKGKNYCDECTDLYSDERTKYNSSGYCIKDIYTLHSYLKDCRGSYDKMQIFEHPKHKGYTDRFDIKEVCETTQIEIHKSTDLGVIYTPCDCESCNKIYKIQLAPF